MLAFQYANMAEQRKRHVAAKEWQGHPGLSAYQSVYSPANQSASAMTGKMRRERNLRAMNRWRRGLDYRRWTIGANCAGLVTRG
jgi:hypothetical protein